MELSHLYSWQVQRLPGVGGHCPIHSYLGWGARLPLKNDCRVCPTCSTTEWGRGHADRILGPQSQTTTRTDVPPPTPAHEQPATMLHALWGHF